MRIEDIKEQKEYKIETINDFVQYYSYWYGMDYRWDTDDGDEYLVVWVKFNALRSMTKVIGESFVDENCEDFHCYFKSECICIPHFEDVLERIGFHEDEIKQIFD